MTAHPSGVAPTTSEPARRFTKSTLPSKACAACGRPFAWRKKWARCWDEVRYCSKACQGRGSR